MASRRYNYVVWTDALEHWDLFELWRAFGRFAITSGRMQPWTVLKLLDINGRPDEKISLSGRMLLTDERPDGIPRCPDGWQGAEINPWKRHRIFPKNIAEE
jgi:hypothetical protein